MLAQQYQIDSFGNMAQTLGGGFVPSFNPASGQAATNQITDLPCASTTPSGTGYDSGGNQLCSTDQYGGISQYTYDGENRISQISALNSSAVPFVSYTYGGDGARTRKTLDSTHFTEYVDFNGEPIAERDQDGNWTDYIYANGKKIARVAQAVPMLHFYGSNPQATVECGAAIGPSNLNYPVRYGDKLSWREYKNNAVGGMMQWFDNNTIGDQWQATDTNGHTVNQDTRQNQWVTRTFDMSSYAGHSLSSLAVLKDVETPAGAWDIWYSDIAILSLNGSVTSVFGSDGVGSIAGAECQGPGVAYGEVQSIGTAPGIPGSGADTHFYLGDHLGTAQMEFSSGGWPVWQGQFAPYGQEIQNGSLLPPDQPDGTANHYKFTGKERDTESGLDYFGARYYANSMGRFMSPDPIKLTDERLLNPANTLNLYSYAANNPLKYVDPDGQDVTFFYDQGGTAGHAVLFAYNQATGDSAIESFGPNHHWPADFGHGMYEMGGITSADDVRGKFAALTIQTSPELAQQVIDYIRANPDPALWTASGPNCSTQVWKILQKFKLAQAHGTDNSKDPGAFPSGIWRNLTAQYKPNASQTPKNGTDYGNPRCSGNCMFNALWLSLPQAPKDNSSVTTSQQDSKDGVPIPPPQQ